LGFPRELKLGGPEAKKHSKDNWYQLEWIELTQIPVINLVPESVEDKLIEMFKNETPDSNSLRKRGASLI